MYLCWYTECSYTCILNVVLIVIVMNDVMLVFIMWSGDILRVLILVVVILSVVILSVVMYH